MAETVNSARLTRTIRWAGEYLRTHLGPAPVTLTLAVLSLIAFGINLAVGRENIIYYLFYPAYFDSVLEPVTGLFLSYRAHNALIVVLLLLIFGPLAERVLGSFKFSLIAAATYLFPTFLLALIFSVALGINLDWAVELGSTPVFGLPMVLMGTLGATSGAMPTIWRRRTRLLTGVLALVLLGFGGSLQDIGVVLALMTGLLCGKFFGVAHPQKAEHSMVGTRHEVRNLVALFIAAVTAGIFLSAHAANPIGPLSAARFGLTPDELTYEALDAVCSGDSINWEECNRSVYLAQTHGLVPAVLATMPLLFQLVLAWGLRHGRRAALWGTVALQTVIAVFAFIHLLYSLDIMAIVSETDLLHAGYQPRSTWRLVLPLLLPLAMIAVVLRTRRFFPIASNGAFTRKFAALMVAVIAAGFAVMMLLAAFIPQGFAPAAQVLPVGLDYLSRLLPSAAWSVLSPSYSATFWLVDLAQEILPIATWMVLTVGSFWLFARPAEHEGAARDEFMALVREHGAGTLGWIATWPGRRYWVSQDGTAGFAYLVNNGVALTVGDPATCQEKTAAAVEEFARFCTDQSLVPALYSVHTPAAQAARHLGWSTWQVAEEAVIELPTLAFSGKKFQSIRTALNHAGKQGIRAEWVTYGSMPLAYWSQIVEISEGWVADKGLPEMGFTLGGLEELKDEETRILVAVDDEGFIHGVTSWMPVHRQGAVIGLTLDFMRRREGDNVFAPSMEFLIASAALDAKDEGLELLSLSGAPLAHSDEPAERSALDRLLDYMGEQMEPIYGFRSLLNFKAKFRPVFDPMYLTTPDASDLMSIGLAVSKAYLPSMTAKDLLAVTSTLSNRGKGNDE